jgi:hypothetical protein
VRLTDHLAALADRGLHSVEIAHCVLPATRLVWSFHCPWVRDLLAT